jgi:hypothetical protein
MGLGTRTMSSSVHPNAQFRSKCLVGDYSADRVLNSAAYIRTEVQQKAPHSAPSRRVDMLVGSNARLRSQMPPGSGQQQTTATPPGSGRVL